jgi:hypothetical protein
VADAKKDTKTTTTNKNKSKEPSQAEQDNNLKKSEALKKIVEHNRDYLKLDLTLPLGDTALKEVHTNQWLFTDLPAEFDLLNWTVIAKALNSNVNRWEGYVENRWYIESVDISVDAGGKAEMKLGLNAFASNYNTYSDAYKSFEKAYTDATTQTTTSTTKSDDGKTTSSAKNTSNAVTNKTSVINEEWVKKYSIPSIIVNKIKEVCKVGNTDEQNVKAWFKWMDAHINYIYYTNHQHDYAWQMSHGGGNCVDNSRMFRAGCLALGVKCTYVHGFSCCAGGECANHQFNKVYLNGKGIIVDTGRKNASWGSHWGSCSGGTSETTTSW